MCSREASLSRAVRAAAALDKTRIVGARAVHRGNSGSHLFVLEFEDGRSVFAKVATSSTTAAWLEREEQVYRTVHAPFMPALLGFSQEEDLPVLMTEDLSDGTWPPPWPLPAIAKVELLITQLAEVGAPPWLPPLSTRFPESRLGWRNIARDPSSFLETDLCSESWLRASLATLRELEAEVDLGGECLVHSDLRSDNLCLFGDRLMAIDWNFASRGPPEFDVHALTPSFVLETGVTDLFRISSVHFMALLAGFWARQSGLPPPHGAPSVRALQAAQFRVAIDWVCRVLALPNPDGRAALGAAEPRLPVAGGA